MPSEHCSREGELLASQLFLCRSRFTSSIASFRAIPRGPACASIFHSPEIVTPIQEESIKGQSSEVKNSIEIPEHTA